MKKARDLAVILLALVGPLLAQDGQAQLDFLRGLTLAEEGSKPEALRMLAASLRLKLRGNPASAVAFELLTELRTHSGLLLRGHTDAVLQVTYSHDGTKIVTASADHTARIWDPTTGKQLTAPLQHGGDVLVAEFSPDGALVVTGSEDHTARVWEVATGKPVGVPIEATGAIRAAKFSPDGRLVAIGAEDGRAGIWNARTGLAVSPVVRYHGTVFSIEFSPDGSRVVTATAEGVAQVLNLQAKPMLTIRHQNNVFRAGFSADGKAILTASADGTATIWDAETGAAQRVFRHGYWITSAAFNLDASRVLTASWDHSARVWEAQTGRAVTPPLQHADAVISAVFSSDGRRIATASLDHTARVWDASSGESLSLPLRTGAEVTTAVFSPDGGSVLVASKDGLVRVVDVAPAEAPPEWLADLCEFAAGQTRYDQSHTPDVRKAQLLRERLMGLKGEGWNRFGLWYFTESSARGVSPWSGVSLELYVEGLIAQGDRQSLEYASGLAQDHPVWMKKIVTLLGRLEPEAPEISSEPGKPAR